MKKDDKYYRDMFKDDPNIASIDPNLGIKSADRVIDPTETNCKDSPRGFIDNPSVSTGMSKSSIQPITGPNGGISQGMPSKPKFGVGDKVICPIKSLGKLKVAYLYYDTVDKVWKYELHNWAGVHTDVEEHLIGPVTNTNNNSVNTTPPSSSQLDHRTDIDDHIDEFVKKWFKDSNNDSDDSKK